MDDSLPEEPIYKVATLGLSRRDKLVVGRIIALSRCRPRCYQLVNFDHPTGIDLALVDTSLASVREEFESYVCHHPTIGYLQILDADAPADTHGARRPFTATKLLGSLDHLAEQIIAKQGARKRPHENQPEPIGHMKGAKKNPSKQRQNGVPIFRALVVDDSLAVRRQVGLALRKSGIEPDFANNGKAALSLLAKTNYEILFLDVEMPEMDGYEVCKRVKQSRSTKNIPVVMLTGKSSSFDRVKGRLSGCNTYLTKPVTIQEFNKALNKCLGRPNDLPSIAGIA